MATLEARFLIIITFVGVAQITAIPPRGISETTHFQCYHDWCSLEEEQYCDHDDRRCESCKSEMWKCNTEMKGTITASCRLYCEAHLSDIIRKQLETSVLNEQRKGEQDCQDLQRENDKLSEKVHNRNVTLVIVGVVFGIFVLFALSMGTKCPQKISQRSKRQRPRGRPHEGQVTTPLTETVPDIAQSSSSGFNSLDTVHMGSLCSGQSSQDLPDRVGKLEKTLKGINPAENSRSQFAASTSIHMDAEAKDSVH